MKAGYSPNKWYEACMTLIYKRALSEGKIHSANVVRNDQHSIIFGNYQILGRPGDNGDIKFEVYKEGDLLLSIRYRNINEVNNCIFSVVINN